MKKVVGTLEETLQAVAEYLGMDAAKLIEYANQDTHTGWDFGEGEWACGSLHRPEGQTLNGIVMVLDIALVIELGAFEGCSTTHLAQAMHDKNNGRVVSVDIAAGAGAKVPEHLQQYVTHINGWAGVELEAVEDNSLRMIYEDASHELEPTTELWHLALKKLMPGGLMISHDPTNESMGHNVVNAVEAVVGDDYLIVQVPPSDCGLIMHRRPMV